MKDLKRHDFGLKIEEDLKEYLSYRIKVDNKDLISWILQQHLIKNLKDKFGEDEITMQSQRIPGMA
jgi:hypothetical protein